MNRFFARIACVSALALSACGGSNAAPGGALPAQQGGARVRFADGAPALETLINGVPQDIGTAYLQMDGATVASQFAYGTLTPFLGVTAGAHSLVARDQLGYAVGPLNSPSLAAGSRYTLIVVGAYPNYRVLAFEEPKTTSGAQLSLYEASPTVPSAEFGSFTASSRSNFKALGNAHLGNVVTIGVGTHVADFGGFVGPPNAPIGTVTPAQINPFDSRNALPFHRIGRLSLFLFDRKYGSVAPVFGSLDQ
ncbi:MAG: DUF4397 domain-containing protein [Candidatus Eremiobacteraeota bacterium]|nr:DUF4397 domain-containing protein [Candidatus Eremiobacteraeota bacterium]MBV9262825.1 DUF4397 domain-containing protein [Candidatus Eremiobacteraeota bacterium]